MDTAVSRLTVFFEEPFWVAVFERESGGRYEACKVTFGAEPKDCEVYDFVLKKFGRLRFSPPVESGVTHEKRISPKRMQREIGKKLVDTGAGTKAQQALKLQQEQDKAAKKTRSRERVRAAEERKFELHREKQKEKHRGR